MDPLSVVGVAMGAASLAFQAFAGCLEGYSMLSATRSFGKDSARISCMLSLKGVQVVEWARRAGLLERLPTLDRRINGAAVCAILKQLRVLLLDKDKLKARYNIGFQEGLPDHTHEYKHSLDIASAFPNASRAEILNRAGIANSMNSLPRRILWAANDKSRFEDLVEHVRLFTTELWRLLDPVTKDDMAHDLREILSQLTRTNARLSSLETLADYTRSQLIPTNSAFKAYHLGTQLV